MILQFFHLDGSLLILISLLCGVGLLVLYSASGESVRIVNRQAMHLAAAYAGMLLLAQVSPQTLQRWSPWLFLLGLLALLAVLLFGEIGKGAQRWINLGFIRFQPSEMMKLAVPMMVAWYLSAFAMPPRSMRILMAMLLVLVPCVMIGMQPDLGTAILVGSAGFFVLFFAGMRLRLIAGLLVVAGTMVPVMWYFFMHAYQRQRVLTFLNPESDPLGSGYHIIQSKIAIGSGGLYGKGWLNGSQSQLDFLPESSTDFIFAVFGEEFGWFGVVMLLLLYLLVVIRGLMIAANSQDRYARMLAGSLSMTFFVYLVVNVGMVTGMLPVVGVPLPLVSYGGTSAVTLMLGFGILMSIQSDRRLLAR
ncbi:MAG: rod shape-determining protein RodA [Gammaproteobacteria bacterium]|nr:rod shape-determining protein RodA [Gammaproteobacteria bacterium]